MFNRYTKLPHKFSNFDSGFSKSALHKTEVVWIIDPRGLQPDLTDTYTWILFTFEFWHGSKLERQIRDQIYKSLVEKA